jgi:hypothetical protein
MYHSMQKTSLYVVEKPVDLGEYCIRNKDFRWD